MSYDTVHLKSTSYDLEIWEAGFKNSGPSSEFIYEVSGTIINNPVSAKFRQNTPGIVPNLVGRTVGEVTLTEELEQKIEELIRSVTQKPLF